MEPRGPSRGLSGPRCGLLRSRFGIGAGLNFNDLDDVDTSSGSATFDESTGYHFGLFLNMGSDQLSLRPGSRLRARQPGEHLSARGPCRHLSSAGEGDFAEAFQDISLSPDIGAGLAFGLGGGGPTLMPELRYSTGITDYWSDDFSVGAVTVSPTARRMSKWMIRLNVMF